MRRMTIPALVSAVALTGITGAGAGTQATLRFTDLVPVRVHGAHFIPGEEVRVTLRAGAAKRVRTAHASASGRFTADFGTLRRSDRCSGSVLVSASGSKGDRASYRLPPMACPTATTARQDS